ncbi:MULTISPECIES: hypothetical protein [unclassified Novosphingobium]|uniref:hypothetical protein n=1 Tax=unclassified Novosphingobium TaxID=2644732 RepID=UPI0012E30AE2|nr:MULTISPECIES: hypothetical protein [unclassified Novosphingobium]MBB3359091.1 hypothetical protein [Novosphingobium sp. BK256]MBB3375428.1 hypothetical protein [Novosphingobium sp. BK280]MBB3379863.1 hypothetical protein [Novosphingobium sp. BK258]MBB3421558.1 hypothetical protein [Novosphingobium sp. BK267]MBB3449873.1 hypothetical protein [Novosphingobium sp. BK352]
MTLTYNASVKKAPSSSELAKITQPPFALSLSKGISAALDFLGASTSSARTGFNIAP